MRSATTDLSDERNSDVSSRIPCDCEEAKLSVGSHALPLHHLAIRVWDSPPVTRGDVLRYYAHVARWLVPHLRGRPLILKRYPDGAGGPHFFMKRAPRDRPDWLSTCRIPDGEDGSVVSVMVQDVASLLWVVDLGCLDLHAWYARCDELERPDGILFDLEPTRGVGFPEVREAALILREALAAVGLSAFVKTSGRRGIHVSVPLARGPERRQVLAFARVFARAVAARHPHLLSAQDRVTRRPTHRVIVDYRRNAAGRTLASVYSLRAGALPCVSTPLMWSEIEGGVTPETFRIDNLPARLERLGDLWGALLRSDDRAQLPRF